MECCSQKTAKYKIMEKDFVMHFDCTNASTLIIIGKRPGYGIINITSNGWNALTNLEIRHVGKVFIEGGASENTRKSILISSCDELRSSKATHWGVITVFESIKNVFIEKIVGEKEKKSIVSIGSA